MAAFHEHDIDEGLLPFSTADLFHYPKNRTGARLKFDRPAFMDEEADKKNIFGYCGDLHCPRCNETFDFMLVEFERTYPDFLSAWREIILEEMDEDIMVCPKCGRRDMELL